MMENDPNDTPQVLNVAEGVWIRQAIDNMGWIDLGGRLAIVDAMEQPELEDEVFAAIGRTTGGEAARWVINSHTHYDHVALNDAFVRRFGAKIVNRKNGSVPDEGLVIEGPRRRVEVHTLPAMHTREDAFVWVPDAKVLFTGDIFGWGLCPQNGPIGPGGAEDIRRTYERFIAFGAETVMPGHGPLITTDHLRRWIAYFDECERLIAAAIREGATNGDLAAACPPPADMHGWWRFLDWKHQNTVEKIAHAVRKGNMGQNG